MSRTRSAAPPSRPFPTVPGRPAVAPRRRRLATLLALVLITVALPTATLARPQHPVIFIHGLASDSDTWDAMKAILDLDDTWTFGGMPQYVEADDVVLLVEPGDYYTMDFSDAFAAECSGQALPLSRRAYEVGRVIEEVLLVNGAEQVILVGHSLGGLSARAYVQSIGMHSLISGLFAFGDDVNQLITIGTPHQGTPLASLCLDLPWLCGIGDFIDPDCPSVGELRPTDLVILGVNNFALNPLPELLVWRSIIGTGTDVFLTTEDGDGVVPATSQNLATLEAFDELDHEAHPLFVPYDSSCNPAPFAQSHTCETSDPGVLAKILDLIPSVPEVPDLIVFSPGVDSADLQTGGTFLLSATVRNQGTTTAAATTLRYYLSSDLTISTSDTPLSTDAVNSLAADATQVLSEPVAAPATAGTYWVGACVDGVAGELTTGNRGSA